jgi:hypothetical protein
MNFPNPGRLGSLRPTLIAAAITLAAAGIVLAWGCGNRRPQENEETDDPDKIPVPSVRFKDVTQPAGIRFTHCNGSFGKKLLPETMGSGVAVFDYDGDGKQDILFVNSRYWPGYEDAKRPAPTLVLYRNNGDGTFEDVTESAGLSRITMYGMGVAVGDYDNDGHPDVFITGLGGNRLLHNEPNGNGGRCFVDVTKISGLGGPGGWPHEPKAAGDFLASHQPLNWSTSATFVDFDGDGKLDLFVCNYLTWSPAGDLMKPFTLPGNQRAFQAPTSFGPAPCFLYRNLGGGRFQDVSHLISSPAGKSLGVLSWDIDEDGWPDILVANDTVRNFLFHNVADSQGGRRFEEIGVKAGVATVQGAERGAMGIDEGEYRPGQLGVFITNFANEPSTLLRLDDPKHLLFSDVARAEGIAGPSKLLLKFGCFFFDYDLDGRQDLLTGSGHLEPDIRKADTSQSYPQPVQLMWNTGGTHPVTGKSYPAFELVTAASAGDDLFRPLVGRGCAYGCFRDNGLLDVVLTENGGPARLLRNEGGTGHHWIRLDLRGDGRRSNSSALGAHVTLKAGKSVQRRSVVGARGYLSQSELPVTFGLGKLDRIDSVTIRWPGSNGGTESWTDLPVDQTHILRQGEGKHP